MEKTVGNISIFGGSITELRRLVEASGTEQTKKGKEENSYFVKFAEKMAFIGCTTLLSETLGRAKKSVDEEIEKAIKENECSCKRLEKIIDIAIKALQELVI